MLPLFCFVPPTAVAIAPPTLSSANYSLGDPGGNGQSIVLAGANLSASTVNVSGGGSVAPSANTPTSVTFTLPARAAGTGYTVSVTTSAGTSNTLSFEYWSPLQLTGVDLYFDARKGMVAVGSAITSWTDQKSAVVASPSSAPTLIANVFGTAPAVRFVPQASLGFSRRQDASYDAGISVFAAVKWTSADATTTSGFGAVPLSLFGDQVSGNPAFGASAGNLAYSLAGSAATGVRGSGLNTGAARLIGLTYAASGNVAKAYLGATQQGANDTAQVYPGTGGMGITTLGNGYGFTDGWAGDIAALVVAKGATVVSGTDLTKIAAWSAQSFGT